MAQNSSRSRAEISEAQKESLASRFAEKGKARQSLPVHEPVRLVSRPDHGLLRAIAKRRKGHLRYSPLIRRAEPEITRMTLVTFLTGNGFMLAVLSRMDFRHGVVPSVTIQFKTYLIVMCSENLPACLGDRLGARFGRISPKKLLP